MGSRPPSTEGPGAVYRTAKYVRTAPGLTSKPTNDSEDRNTMVGTARATLRAMAARCAAAITDDVVVYTPRQLNELISKVSSDEVAGRLREHAAQHEHAAGTHYARPRAEWHGAEATWLNELVDRELSARAGGDR